jgi:hypothetical protein
VAVLNKLVPVLIIHVTCAQVELSDMSEGVRQKFMERDTAFKHTELNTIPVSGLFIVVFLDTVAVEFGEFFV